jgi:hypothetical protein
MERSKVLVYWRESPRINRSATPHCFLSEVFPERKQCGMALREPSLYCLMCCHPTSLHTCVATPSQGMVVRHNLFLGQLWSFLSGDPFLSVDLCFGYERKHEVCSRQQMPYHLLMWLQNLPSLFYSGAHIWNNTPIRAVSAGSMKASMLKAQLKHKDNAQKWVKWAQNLSMSTRNPSVKVQ